MSDPRVIISGPFDEAGNKQGPTTPLYLGSNAEVNTETELNSKDVPGQGSDEAVISPLEAKRDFSYDGQVGALLLEREGYGDSPKEAARNYIFELESLVLAQQSSGYRLQDKENSYDQSPNTDGPAVLVEEVSWTYKDGDNLQVEWDISLKQSQGVQAQSTSVSRDEYIETQKNNVKSSPIDELVLSSGDVLNLGSAEKINVIRRVDIEAQQLLHNSDTPQVGAINSGVKEEVRLDGVVSNKTAVETPFVSSLNDWANKIGTDAHGVQSVVTESLTGREFQGSVENTQTSFESGKPRALDYSLTFKIGTADLFN